MICSVQDVHFSGSFGVNTKKGGGMRVLLVYLWQSLLGYYSNGDFNVANNGEPLFSSNSAYNGFGRREFL